MRRPILFALVCTVAALASAQESPAPKVPPLLGDHLEATSALAREHFQHASVDGTVVRADGEPWIGATVVVLAYQPWYGAVPVAIARTDAQGAYHLGDVTGIGHPQLWVVSPPEAPLHVETAPLTLVSGRHTQMRPFVMQARIGMTAAPTTFRGRVLDADGAPIAGALVQLIGKGDGFDPSTFASTAADGSFAIAVRSVVANAHVFFGSTKYEIEHAPGVTMLTKDALQYQLDLTGERELRCPESTHVGLSATGAEGIECAWLRADAFVPCASDGVPARSGGGGSARVRVTAPGCMPRLASAPANQTIDFASDQAMTLAVVDDAGTPLADATVDLCVPGDRRFEERLLQTLHTGVDGNLALRGEVGVETVVYVYAAGCEPARIVWRGGTDARAVLRRCSGTLELPVPDAESAVYVRRAGTFDIAAMEYPPAGTLRIALAPGDYEVTRYHQGPVAAAEAASVSAGAVTSIALTADQRPVVTITVPALDPDDKWWTYGSRSAIGGMITKYMIYSQLGGPMPRRELVAESETIEDSGNRRFRLRMPTSGRYTLFVGHEQLGVRFFREVALAFGGDYAIELPELAAKLGGTVANYPEAWTSGFEMHGVVGPRLVLAPEQATPFGVMVALPEPAKFVVDHLPPGHFTLHHHLYETGILWSEKGTWGGAAIEIGRDVCTDAGALQRGPDAALEVRVVAADGRPATGVLAIRDRMFEAWQHDLDQRTTLDDAADPIPTPPAQRLADGRAHLDRVRKGRVDFELLLDDGRRVLFARDVDPGVTLEVRLAVLTAQ